MHAYANRCKYKPAHTATQTHALTTLQLPKIYRGGDY